MQKLSGRFMAVFLQDYPRDDLTREIVQPLQGGFNIVGVRGDRGAKEFTAQDGR